MPLRRLYCLSMILSLFACRGDKASPGGDGAADSGGAGEEGGEGADGGGATEECNGLDDDGDGLVDEDVQMATCYADLDGDGYGSGEAVQTSCACSESQSELDGDCDETDPQVYPGAPERCDGVDQSCDGSLEDEAGLAWMLPDEGEGWDASDALTGSAGDPALVVLDVPGRLWLCPGTWFVSLRVRADLQVTGLGEGVELSGGGVEGVVVNREPGAALQLQDLTIADGQGSGAYKGEFSAGGGLECDGGESLRLERVAVRGNLADLGGGLYARGCDVEVLDSDFSGNVANHGGGGLAVLDGHLQMSGSRLSSNSSTHGGGLALLADEAEASATITDSRIEANVAERLGGGLWLLDAPLVCAAESRDDAGVANNLAGAGGAAWIQGTASLQSIGCDWGSGDTENMPGDLYPLGDSLGEDETTTCDSLECL